MLYRLRNNFRLSIITMLGVCAIVGVTPFAIYRFVQGDLLAGTVDTVIILCILTAMLYAWVTGDTRRSGFCVAIIACAGGATVASVLGTIGLFWLYPPFITSFFLTPPRLAVIINLATLLVLMVLNIGFQSFEYMLSFATTAIVVSACAYIFALRNETQRRRLEQLAILDPLTGVKNRRAMEQELKTAVAFHRRSGLTYALTILDLDHFKSVNDAYGHAVGDQVLLDCAQIILKHTRKTDQLFRFGGEEFVLLLSGVDDYGMRAVLRNVYRVLRRDLKCPGGPVTASYGLTMLQDDDTPDSWLERADDALYKAKADGRDRVVVAGEPNAMV